MSTSKNRTTLNPSQSGQSISSLIHWPLSLATKEHALSLSLSLRYKSTQSIGLYDNSLFPATWDSEKNLRVLIRYWLLSNMASDQLGLGQFSTLPCSGHVIKALLIPVLLDM